MDIPPAWFARRKTPPSCTVHFQWKRGSRWIRYPWNWIPVVDQEKDQQAGYFFGVDAMGHVSLQVDLDGVWQSVTSTAQLPLKKWAQIVGDLRGESRADNLN